MVAGWQADRLPEQARSRGSRSHDERRLVDPRSPPRHEDLWIVDAAGPIEPRQLTKTPEGEGGRPSWSPDGSRIAVLISDTDQNTAYGMNKLVVVPSNPPQQNGPTQKPTVYMPTLDRAVSNVAWSADGQNISFLLQ